LYFSLVLFHIVEVLGNVFPLFHQHVHGGVVRILIVAWASKLDKKFEHQKVSANRCRASLMRKIRGKWNANYLGTQRNASLAKTKGDESAQRVQEF
jgi:hypothetical protein